MARKSFTSKAQTARKVVEFEFDGVLLYAQQPKFATMLDLADLVDSGPVEQVHGAVDFIEQCLVPDSRDYIFNRLHDPDDNLEITDLTELMQWVTEEFTARPTMPPAPSRPPSPRTGKPSTGRSRSTASRRSTSRRTEDSTSASPLSESA